MGITAKGKKNAGLLTEGSIAKGILSFAIPLFLGQLLQQFYNVADSWGSTIKVVVPCLEATVTSSAGVTSVDSR